MTEFDRYRLDVKTMYLEQNRFESKKGRLFGKKYEAVRESQIEVRNYLSLEVSFSSSSSELDESVAFKSVGRLRSPGRFGFGENS